MASKRLKILLLSLDKQGCRVVETTKGYQVFPPSGSEPITIHKTTSDWRAEKDVRARVRRAGLDWPFK